MPTIALTNGGFMRFDIADWEVVANRRWHRIDVAAGISYAQTTDDQSVLAHRLILDAPKGMEVDHINHDGLDNRRDNLRLATRSQNHGNQRLVRRNTSGFKGVTWNGQTGSWKAQIKIDRRNRHLGLFATAEEAGAAYDRAAVEIFGEFACTNRTLRERGAS